MALFGSKEKAPSSKTVRPTVIRTQNVANELFNIAKSYDIKPETLDLNILEVQTYIRIEDKNPEWELIEDEKLYELDDEKELLNPNFQIKQTYEIEIFSKSDEQFLPCRDMKMAVGANASKCKVYLSVAAGSSLAYTPELESSLLREIDKRKVRAGILIHIFDEMLEAMVSKFCARIQVAERLTFEKNETILIAEGIEPTATTDDALIFHFEKGEEVDEKKRIDYASRDFIRSVKKDELLIEYIKPKNGKAIDDSIRIEESDDYIRYFAVDKGYIALEENKYTIKKDVDIGEISFKTTGSIKSGINSDVNISVTESDAIKDAIGTGMHVEVSEIDIDGNVGSNAHVYAKKASIGGQTHKTATIRADKLDINVHKGKAYGKNVHVTRLEHGYIQGEKVEIAQALGGKIEAKEIRIELCASHVKASASKLIEIQKLQGSENIFVIDPLQSKETQSGVNKNKDEIKTLEKEIKELENKIKELTPLVEDGTPAFLDIKKRLIAYKKKGVKMPASFVKKYKEFQELQFSLKESQESFAAKSDHHKLLTTRTSSFQDNIFDARVINRDRWVGYNEIRFKLVNPVTELVFKPKEGSEDKIFGLVEIEDGVFEIQAMQE